MKRGSIVKIATDKLFNERTMRRNKAPWVYGSLFGIEEECEETGEKAWTVNWACTHLFISDLMFQHIVPRLCAGTR